jgi:hypothetical protein
LLGFKRDLYLPSHLLERHQKRPSAEEAVNHQPEELQKKRGRKPVSGGSNLVIGAKSLEPLRSLVSDQM